MKREILIKRSVGRFTMLVLFLGLLGWTKLNAQDIIVGDLYYSVNNDSVSVKVTGHVDGSLATGSLMIPDSVTFDGATYPVTTIGAWAFQNCTGFTGSLIIPNSVTTIEAGAFSNCSGFTADLTIPNSVNSVAYSAFNGTQWYNSQSLGILYLDGWCLGYKDIMPTGTLVLDGDIKGIAELAFYNCNGLTGDLILPNSVVLIGSKAFNRCRGLTSISIPGSVTTIGAGAFADCSGITGGVIIPNSVTSIGDEAFASCNGLDQIVVEDGNPVYDSRGNCNAIIETETNRMVAGCKNTLIPNSVVSIGASAFMNCKGLTSLEIPNSVVSIESNAFVNCSGLTSIVIPNSVISIGNWAFDGCTGMTSIELPNSLTTIMQMAFAGCTNLKSLVSHAEVPPTIGYQAFDRVPSNIEVYVPCNVVETYQSTSGWNRFSNIKGLCPGNVTVVVTPTEGGTVTGAGAYEGGAICTLIAHANEGYTFRCWKENDVVVSTDVNYSIYVAGDRNFVAEFRPPNSIVFADLNVEAICLAFWDTNEDGGLSFAEAASVIDLGGAFTQNGTITTFDELQYFTGLGGISSYAFAYCKKLTSLIIPNTVTSIGEMAFNECLNLSAVTIPNSVTSIGEGAFELCRSLSSLTIPNSVTSIGGEAFAFCYGLTSITIPNSVISVGTGLFYCCSSLGQIVVETGNLVYDSRENCNAIIETSTNQLVAGCKNTIIPNTVTSIGISAFDGHSSLTSITIPGSVTSIGAYAFRYCGSLTSIIIPSSVTLIGNYAFDQCGLTTVTISGSETTIGNGAFRLCTSLTSMIVMADNPPALGNGVFNNVDMTIPVYVPCNSMTAYQATEGWNGFSNYIEMCPGTITVAVEPTLCGTVTGGGTYEYGSTCTLTATPNDGYQFLYWSENGAMVGTDPSYSFIVIGDANYVANFAEEGSMCAITFELFDSYGDGYTGNYLVVNYPDGISQQLTVESGSSASHTLWIAQDSHIVLTWILGSYPEDCSFTVSYLDGDLIYHGSNLTDDFNYEFDVDCQGMLENHWIPEGAAYSEIMQLYSVIQIDGMEQYSNTLEVGAFCGNECRGSAFAQEYLRTHRYLVVMDVFGETGQQLTFKLYDHNTNQELEAVIQDTISFIEGSYGSPTDPYVLEFVTPEAQTITQTTSLSAGWNWFTLYVEGDPIELLHELEESVGDNCLWIESNVDGTTENLGEGLWLGDLEDIGLVCGQMYLIQAVDDCTVELQGTPANPEDYTFYIYPGYNWIGFPFSEEVEVTDALANFEAEEGDQIESPDGVLEYLGDGLWLGDFGMLVPGQGYLYYSVSDQPKTLVYSTLAKGKGRTHLGKRK